MPDASNFQIQNKNRFNFFFNRIWIRKFRHMILKDWSRHEYKSLRIVIRERSLKFWLYLIFIWVSTGENVYKTVI